MTPHVPVTERPTYFEGGPPLVHVKVRAADVRRRYPDQDIGGSLDLRVRDVLRADLTGTLVHRYFHVYSDPIVLLDVFRARSLRRRPNP